MHGRRKMLATSAAAAVLGIVGSAALAQSGGVDSDTPITGPALDEASRTALDHLGEGRVTQTEVGDEDSYYEVEVTLDDGSEVDVQLDREFRVVGAEDDGTGDRDD